LALGLTRMYSLLVNTEPAMRCVALRTMSVGNLPMRRDTIVKGDNRVNVSIIATHVTKTCSCRHM